MAQCAENAAQITRKDAMAAGLKRYFTGKSCKRGHVVERTVSSYGCVDCLAITAVALNAAHPERHSVYQARYRTNNPGKVAEAQRANDARPERKERQRLRAARKRKTPDGIAYGQEYRSRPEVKKADAARQKTPAGKARGCRHKAKPETKLKAAQRMREVRATPMGCLNNRMSVALNRGLKTGKDGATWSALVGYTADELRRHLERQFLPKMSWANTNIWHIDHIIPLASFSFTSPDDPEFKAAWSLANLRPLWALKNMSKGAKREFLL